MKLEIRNKEVKRKVKNWKERKKLKGKLEVREFDKKIKKIKGSN